MNWYITAAVFILTCCVSSALAQITDRHDTPECRDALTALRANPTDMDLRNRAAHLCLGGNPDFVPRRGRMVQPPVAVTTIPVVPTVAPAVAPPSPATAVAVPIAAPTSLTSCDPGGCWANDGTRLILFDRYLIGPRGICTVQGTALQCPP